jgi:hypothetical protein
MPSGLRLLFEGERADLDHTADLLKLGEVVGSGLEAAPLTPLLNEGDDAAGDNSLDPKSLAKQLEKVGATTHIQRVTVMSQAAIDAGMEGLDFTTVEQLYKNLGVAKPGSWKATFSNARTAGLVQNVGRGKWKPTTKGENYALYGTEG